MTTATVTERRFTRHADGAYFEATAKLRSIGGQRPYFSLTGEEWEKFPTKAQRRSERLLVRCGAIGDRLAEIMPELSEFARMHLADDTGAPVHAEANGWYWYSDYDGKGTNLYPHQETYSLTPHERAARYLRVDPSELPEGLTRDEFAAYVDSLRDRWQDDADRAIAFLRGVA